MNDAVSECDDKAALIVGASPELAAGIAQAFKSKGIPVSIIGDTGPSTDGGRIGRSANEVDLCDHESVSSHVAELVKEFTRIGYLVHVSQVDEPGSFLDTDLQDFDRIVESSLTPAFVVGQVVAKEIARCGGGSIVMLSLTDATASSNTNAVASACQAAIAQLVRIMSVDLANAGIRVNALVGTVDLSHVDALAAAAAFLACDEPSYVNGQILDASSLVVHSTAQSAGWAEGPAPLSESP